MKNVRQGWKGEEGGGTKGMLGKREKRRERKTKEGIKKERM